MAKPLEELDEVLGELATLLKEPEVSSGLAEQGINASLALLAAQALRSYVHGERLRASEDFACVAEEIIARASFKQVPS